MGINALRLGCSLTDGSNSYALTQLKWTKVKGEPVGSNLEDACAFFQTGFKTRSKFFFLHQPACHELIVTVLQQPSQVYW